MVVFSFPKRRLQRVAALAAALMAALWAAPAAAAPQPSRVIGGFDFERTPGTLPKSIRPLQQRLLLDVDPERDEFRGQTTIRLQLSQPMPAVELHARQLVLDSAAIERGGRRRALEVAIDDERQTWTLTPRDGAPLPAGAATLHIQWQGRVQRTDSGLYRVPYGPKGQRRQMLATQLEAVFARLMFPAFDEPAFRLRFDVAVRAPAGYQVLANMPERSQRNEPGGKVLHRFATTPAMPSYLVALSVGQFDLLRGTAAGVPLRIFTEPGRAQQARYAMQATERLLPYFQHYFGQPYTLPKLDQLAVPGIRDGAMEDWGLISYAEGALLFDPETSDRGRQQRIFGIVAHELAHQWFGNLVTAASWDEIWLNEAFATWLADKAAHRFNPDWQVPLRRRARIDSAMARDATDASRPIRGGKVREDAVFDVFDDITYTKGGAVLSMLEQWIGEERFRAGLRGYMKARRLSNATAADLWHHMGRAAGRDVAAVAASWTDQTGYPLIGVDSRCEAGRTRIVLTQTPMRGAQLEHGGPPKAQPRWQVPVTMQHGEHSAQLLLTEPQQTLELPGCPATPTVLNPKAQGFYRVAYGAAQRESLARAFPALPRATQVMLLSDAFALAQTGQSPLAEWIGLAAAVRKVQGEGREALVKQLIEGLELLHDAFDGSAAQAALNLAAQALLAPELQALGWDAVPGESNVAESLRGELIVALARAGDAAVRSSARQRFDDDESGRAPLPPAIRFAVVRAMGHDADAAHFAVLRRRLLEAGSERDRFMYALALSGVEDRELGRQVLALSLDEAVPSNIAIALPGMLGERPAQREQVYTFVEQNWAALARRTGPMFGGTANLLPRAAQHATERAMADRLLQDQQRLMGAAGEGKARRAAARIAQRAELLQRELAALPQALQGLSPHAP